MYCNIRSKLQLLDHSSIKKFYSYISGCAFQDLALMTNPIFSWLVDCAMDTTVKATYCAYDR